MRERDGADPSPYPALDTPPLSREERKERDVREKWECWGRKTDYIFVTIFYAFECIFVRIHMYTLEIEHTRRSAIATSSLQSNLRTGVIKKNTTRGETEREKEEMMHKQGQGNTRN